MPVLSESQRQKLHMARCLLKKPDFLIVNQALNTLDARAHQHILDNVLAKSRGRDGDSFGVIWSPMNLSVAADVRRRMSVWLGNPPPHVGGYGATSQSAAFFGPWNLSPRKQAGPSPRRSETPRLDPLNRSSRRQEAHSISDPDRQSLLTSAATRFMERGRAAEDQINAR